MNHVECALPEDPLASAVAACDALRAALARHGVSLPSLAPDVASCTASPSRALVELVRARPDVVARLAAVLARVDVG